jgi:hypothetical protein
MATLRNEGRSAGLKAGGRQDWPPHKTCRLKATLEAEQAAENVFRRAWPRATEVTKLLICLCGACATKTGGAK